MVILFKPLFIDKLWGGDSLKKMYGFQCSDQCGECWGISALEKASNEIDHPAFKGLTLRTLFQTRKDLFGHYPSTEFPILVKLIDAAKPLSVQVHPDDAYAARYQSLGKEECWTILSSAPTSELIIGHTFESADALKKSLENNTFMSHVQRVNINPGDFFYIPTGTLHAIGEGITLLEVQQSSDVTLRLYDYDRLEHGQRRLLHLEEAIDVLRFPDPHIMREPRDTFFHYALKTLHSTTTHAASQYGDYLFILEGSGWIDETPVKKGDFLMISSFHTALMQGVFTAQITTLNP